MDISRRNMIGGLFAGCAGSLVVLKAPVAQAAAQSGSDSTGLTPKSPLKKHRNEDFYNNGAFDAAAAKEAYYDLMRSFDYPIPDRLRTDDFWALDFSVGNFTEVGMAGIFWVNNKEHNYFGHEIYLLPGQMIPEHKHVKTAAAGPKLEGWHVRYGLIYTYAEGQPNPGDEDRIPASHKECAKARSAKKVLPGEVNTLAGPEQWHWMLAGPDGAIVTEYATYHDSAGLRFSHPKAKL